MSKSVFQSGISWRVVENKWEGTTAALAGFDPAKLTALTPDDVDRLCTDTRLIRNRRKIEGTVHNARTMLELERAHGTFPKYLRSHDGYEALAADLKKRFKFLGDMGVYHFLWVVSEPVPDYDDWCATHNGGRRRHQPTIG